MLFDIVLIAAVHLAYRGNPSILHCLISGIMLLAIVISFHVWVTLNVYLFPAHYTAVSSESHASTAQLQLVTKQPSKTMLILDIKDNLQNLSKKC